MRVRRDEKVDSRGGGARDTSRKMRSKERVNNK